MKYEKQINRVTLTELGYGERALFGSSRDKVVTRPVARWPSRLAIIILIHRTVGSIQRSKVTIMADFAYFRGKIAGINRCLIISFIYRMHCSSV